MTAQPHGSMLVEKIITQGQFREMNVERDITISERLVFDTLMIGIGGFSPLNGFLGEEDYRSVVERMRLESGVLFAVPIVLPVDRSTFESVRTGETVALRSGDATAVGTLTVEGKFQRNFELEARGVYGTDDREHPGVAKIHEEGPYCLSGDIHVILEAIDTGFPDYFLTPRKTREYFKEMGWNTVAAFQTRNPIHRAHEYLTKVALEMVDGLMIHPIVGELKKDDIPADVRMHCYATLLDNYYNRDRVLLNILPMAMRYAGPREAIHHAVIRQNYGITHLIIGRDHAGVGSYYGTYDAQKIFDTLEPRDLEIEALKFEHAFFCTRCGQMVTAKTCGHDKTNHVFLSGTKVREKLRAGEDLPEEFTRKEVSHVLKQWINA